MRCDVGPFPLREVVDDEDVVIAIEERLDDVRTDEAGASCDERARQVERYGATPPPEPSSSGSKVSVVVVSVSVDVVVVGSVVVVSVLVVSVVELVVDEVVVELVVDEVVVGSVVVEDVLVVPSPPSPDARATSAITRPITIAATRPIKAFCAPDIGGLSFGS